MSTMPTADLPLLVLLPGLDGTGKRFADFMRVIAANIDAQVVSYPLGLPLGYEELEAKNPNPFPKWARPLAALLPLKALPRWVRAPLMWGSYQARRVPAQADRAIANVAGVVVRRRIAALLAVDASDALRRITLPHTGVVRAQRSHHPVACNPMDRNARCRLAARGDRRAAPVAAIPSIGVCRAGVEIHAQRGAIRLRPNNIHRLRFSVL